MNIAQEILNSGLIAGMKNLLWAPREVRRHIQDHGLNLVPANFYSNIPSQAEVETAFEYTEEAAPFLNETIFGAARMRETLESLCGHTAGFEPDVEGDEATCANGYFWTNSQFSFSDAMSYFAFLRMLKPRRVVEIGSGFSTLVAREALARNGTGKLTCIEPFPRDFLAKLDGIELIRSKAQDITAAQLDDMLEDGDVLFIDSTHTVKAGSDCLHIYLRLLPHLTKRVYVHIHDIFLPFGMPKDWLLDLHIYWTEQYLVLAWLQDNPRTSVLYGSAYHEKFNAELLDKFMDGKFQAGGGSLWLEYRPRAA